MTNVSLLLIPCFVILCQVGVIIATDELQSSLLAGSNGDSNVTLPKKDEKEIEVGMKILMEYNKVLTSEQFGKILQIYGSPNKSKSALERERDVVNYLSNELTEEEKRRLPIPYSFRHLNSEAQQKIKEIYFERNVAFDVKLYNIGIALYHLPMEERRKVLQNRTVNDEPMMGLIEFELNVTATYNGFFEKERIKSFMNKEEQEELQRILAENLPRHEKNFAIGQLLRKVYQRDPDTNIRRWPGMYGTESVLTDQQRYAITHMLFSEHPMTDATPFVRMLEQIVENQQKLKQQEPLQRAENPNTSRQRRALRAKRIAN